MNSRSIVLGINSVSITLKLTNLESTKPFTDKFRINKKTADYLRWRFTERLRYFRFARVNHIMPTWLL